MMLQASSRQTSRREIFRQDFFHYRVPFQAEICHEWFRASMDDPGCWSQFLGGPEDGNLNREELPAVLSVLRTFAKNQDSFFRFSEIAFIATDKPIHFCGILDELSTFLTNGKHQFIPEYWWPADHSWCVCSDCDLAFTIVAGSKELVSGVLNDATLEAMRPSDYRPLYGYAVIVCHEHSKQP
jgi:hypothetical protein